MFCKNCNRELLADEKICTQCGAPAGKGQNYCQNCGTYTPPETTNCPRCGAFVKTEEPPAFVPQFHYQPPKPVTQYPKSRLAVGVVAALFGSLGLHNFYLGHKGRGIAQLVLTLCGLFTLGLTTIASSIWAIVEAIMILSGSVNCDAYGIEFKA